MNIPENKTVAQLKVELTHRGIEFPTNAKKAQLIRLWKTHAMRTTATSNSTLVRHDTLPEVPPEVREIPATSEPESSQNPPQDVHKHGAFSVFNDNSNHGETR